MSIRINQNNLNNRKTSYNIVSQPTSPFLVYGPSLCQAFTDLLTTEGRQRITDLFHKVTYPYSSIEDSRNALMDLVGKISNGLYSLLSASQMSLIFASVFGATNQFFQLTAPVKQLFTAINPIGVALTGIDFIYTLERLRQSRAFYKQIESQGSVDQQFAFLTDLNHTIANFASKMEPWVLETIKQHRKNNAQPSVTEKEKLINLVKDHIQRIMTVQTTSLLLIGTTLAGFVTALTLCPPMIPLLLFSVAGVGGLLHYFWAQRYLSDPNKT